MYVGMYEKGNQYENNNECDKLMATVTMTMEIV